MISEERSNHVAKQALNFPVGLLISSPKRRLAKLGRKPSNGSVQYLFKYGGGNRARVFILLRNRRRAVLLSFYSPARKVQDVWSNSSSITTRSAESVGVRQPAKNKIRRHNNRLSTVFSRSPYLKDSQRVGDSAVMGGIQVTDDPAELSMQVSAPGVLKIFGNEISQGANYKSVLATPRSSAKELVKEALERYSLDKAEAGDYVLCDVIGRTGEDHQWRTECFRVVGDHEKPLMLQSLWKPKEGFSRRFEIQKKSSVEEKTAREKDTLTAGINAQARKLQKIRSRVTSAFIDDNVNSSLALWRSVSEMDLSVKSKDPRKAKPLLLEDTEPEADKEAQCLRIEKEETESSDDNATQYSIHPPFDFPYFLLLQGYSYRQDFVIYLLSGVTHIFGRCSEHSTGEDVEHLKVDILLSAPDVLPQHCCVHRLETPGQGDRAKRTVTLARPLHGAPVTHNGAPLKGEAELRPGDLLGLGDHYVFMFKDPIAPAANQRPTWLMSHAPGLTGTCRTCGSALKSKAAYLRLLPLLKDPDGADLSLPYDPEHEDQLLRRIIHLTDPKGSDPCLTPAFLLCLCIQHAATSLEMADIRRLLLRIASQVQTAMWERTKELAAIQGSSRAEPDPEELSLLGIKELIPGLQPLVFWMANSIELLHFIQQDVPKLLHWDSEEDIAEMSDSQVSATRSASEEAMTVLEEVIMFTFQQSVYYLTKTLYATLPGLLDSNPFSESGQLCIPEGVSSILDILKETLQLLNQYQVHAEIASQLFAYLFFFTNASLFNALMERGSGGGFYQWSKGVQIRANLDLLIDWIQGIGLGDLALDFFQKLSSAINLLAKPKENLLQASWRSLRSEFANLNPAQLHHMLRGYNPGRSCPAGWSPAPEEADAAMRTADILEGFDNHPPLILPSSSFHIELGKPVKEPGLLSQLSQLKDFLQQLRATEPSASTTQPQQVSCSPNGTEESASPEEGSSEQASRKPRAEEESKEKDASVVPPHGRFSHAACSGDLSSCEAVLTQKLKNLELQSSLPGQADLSCHKRLALDPSCLLTPPNTPQGLELAEAEADLQEGTYKHIVNGSSPDREGGFSQRKHHSPAFVFPRGFSGSFSPCKTVVAVSYYHCDEGVLQPLVSAFFLTKTQLKMSGIYIRSVIPDSPAAMCKKLHMGDRILAVNGASLVGIDYSIGRELIRSSGDRLRLLVAKSELRGSSCISPTNC
ncbi:RADIL protein, partial [Atractosteus spatula]|nr:RADIL protein [Atractosteus spatula]